MAEGPICLYKWAENEWVIRIDQKQTNYFAGFTPDSNQLKVVYRQNPSTEFVVGFLCTYGKTVESLSHDDFVALETAVRFDMQTRAIAPGAKVTADYFDSTERKAAHDAVCKAFGLPAGSVLHYFSGDGTNDWSGVNHGAATELAAKDAEIAALKAEINTKATALTLAECEVAEIKKTGRYSLESVNNAWIAGAESKSKDINELVQQVAERDLQIVGLKAYSMAGDREIAAIKRELAALKLELADHQQDAKPTTLALNRAYKQGVDAQRLGDSDCISRLTNDLEKARARRDKWQSAFEQLAGNISRDVDAARRLSNS